MNNNFFINLKCQYEIIENCRYIKNLIHIFKFYFKFHFSHGVQEEMNAKQEFSEFEQIMAQPGLPELQNDTLAELESTLNLATEMAMLKDNVPNSSTAPPPYGNILSTNNYISQPYSSCTPFGNLSSYEESRSTTCSTM